MHVVVNHGLIISINFFPTDELHNFPIIYEILKMILDLMG